MPGRKATKTTKKSKITPPSSLSVLKVKNSLNQAKASLANNKTIYLLIILLGLALLLYYKRGLLIAATVNGSPITTIELQKRLNDLYHQQTLNQMIDEKLITQEADKHHVSVTNQDIQARISQIEQSFGGPQGLDAILTQQGQTRSGLADQLKYQLLVERLYQSQATVSASEVDQFISSNKDSLKATDSAGQRKEAEDTIKNQKLAQIFSQQFKALKDAAKITIY